MTFWRPDVAYGEDPSDIALVTRSGGEGELCANIGEIIANREVSGVAQVRAGDGWMVSRTMAPGKAGLT